MRVIVAGAGPAGVAAARCLAMRGHDVVLLEATDRVGGLAASFDFAGMRVDYGSHRLHPTCDTRVMGDLRRLLGPDLVRRPRHGRIRLRDRWIAYPLRPGSMLRTLPLRTSAAFARDLLTNPLRPPHPGATSYADVLRQRFGPTLCEEFYFPYARKLWGTEPSTLDGEQARRRVSATSLAAVAARAARGMFAGPSHFAYPRGGFGRISEVLCDDAAAAGADIRFSSRISAVTDTATGVCAAYGNDSVEGDLLLSTLPLSTLREITTAPAGPAEAALPARGMLLVYLAFDVGTFSEWDAHYVASDAFVTSRVSEPKLYSGSDVPRGRTVLCVEIPASPHEPLWKARDAVVTSRALAELVDLALPVPGDPVETTVRRVTDVYPVYTPATLARRRDLLAWAGRLHRVRTLGRQGLFVHDNSHHALAMGYAAAACAGPHGFDHERWAEACRAWESNTVED
ncbi:MAG: FAD-dependent oxidoreductase [Acidimicrobiia bacterium]|nr:FAD-dependent oxidoreductase [Acidimicrobiia bacterium]